MCDFTKQSSATIICRHFQSIATDAMQKCQKEGNEGMEMLLHQYDRDITAEGIGKGSAKTLYAIVKLLETVDNI